MGNNFKGFAPLLDDMVLTAPYISRKFSQSNPPFQKTVARCLIEAPKVIEQIKALRDEKPLFGRASEDIIYPVHLGAGKPARAKYDECVTMTVDVNPVMAAMVGSWMVYMKKSDEAYRATVEIAPRWTHHNSSDEKSIKTTTGGSS